MDAIAPIVSNPTPILGQVLAIQFWCSNILTAGTVAGATSLLLCEQPLSDNAISQASAPTEPGRGNCQVGQINIPNVAQNPNVISWLPLYVHAGPPSRADRSNARRTQCNVPYGPMPQPA